ncbi:MAG: NlpC/P60 family protein [Treponema sp.]|uniref:NlpC/P60 family protein n=1 Tax=Treponema sp. TaxID=166 RepID=UPI002A9195D2|nr:NlpC/P60 family protein [Treponema sp.]MDY6397781.1 NlpC/P60 family protein [Treponema sp.]
MKIRRYLIAALSFLIISCNNGTDDKTSFTEIDVPDEISERAYSFAELYEQSDTEYHLGGQDPVRAIQIDCSGLIIMCYKYALVDTKYQLLVSDMAVDYLFHNASTHIARTDLKKGNLIFMGKAERPEVTHIALFEKRENGRIYFIDSTQKDTNGDGINDIDGVTYRDYAEDDSRFKAFGRMKVKY